MEIDHDKDEPERDDTWSPWPWVFLATCVSSGLLWATRGLDWPSVIIGAAVTFAASFWFVDWFRYGLFKSWRDTGRDR